MLDYSKIPVDYMVEGMKNYVEFGYEPGHFLGSVLQNDLHGAVAYADVENACKLSEWVRWMYNELPVFAWGSPKNYQAWMVARRLENNE